MTVAGGVPALTVPGRGFYPMFRFYSPTAPLFDGTWALPDVERM